MKMTTGIFLVLLTLGVSGDAGAQQPKDDDERLTQWVGWAQEWIQESCSTTASRMQKNFCSSDARELRLLTAYQVCNAKHKTYVARTKCQHDVEDAIYGSKSVDEHFDARLKVAEKFDRGEIRASQVEAEMAKYVPQVSSTVGDPNSPMNKHIRSLEIQAQRAPRGSIPGLPPGILVGLQMKIEDRQSARTYDRDIAALQKIIERLAAGNPITEQEKETLRSQFSALAKSGMISQQDLAAILQNLKNNK
jgi:hypothetical protein